jgi:hypothetical protein
MAALIATAITPRFMLLTRRGTLLYATVNPNPLVLEERVASKPSDDRDRSKSTLGRDISPK